MNRSKSFTKPPLAILFDLDGTIVDSAHDLLAVANSMRLNRNLKALEYDQQLRSTVSKGVAGILKIALNINSDSLDFEKYQNEFLNLYQQQLCKQSVIFPGVIPLLNYIVEKNIKWGIVTNKAQRFAIPLIDELCLKQNLPRPNILVGGDTTPYAKPHPRPILYACQQINVIPTYDNVWYVGDDIRDIQAAHNANVLGIAAAYGYLGENANIKTWNSDLVIFDILELKEFL